MVAEQQETRRNHFVAASSSSSSSEARAAHQAARAARRWRQQRSKERILFVSLFGFLFIALSIAAKKSDQSILLQPSYHRDLLMESEDSSYYHNKVTTTLEDEEYLASTYPFQQNQQHKQQRQRKLLSRSSLTDLLKKCSPWDVNIDSWWQSNPQWEPYGDNETHTCFRQIQDPRRASFYQEVYESQYHSGKDCSQMKIRSLIGVGYAAAVGHVTTGFWSAFRSGYPFQMSIPSEGYRYMYVPPYNFTEGANNSWASCPNQDLYCYFLPVSNCEQPITYKDDEVLQRYTRRELRADKVRREQYMWLKWYMARPRQETRRRLRQLMEKEAPRIEEGASCTWIHVRRTDATTEQWVHKRNFYPISEYLERGNVSKEENILLLTDDQSAIEEALLLHPQYKWTYWNRTRHRGKVRKNSHIPSNDEAKEMLIILAEIELAGKCQKGIHGTSNMVKLFQESMARQHGLSNIELIEIDGELKEEREDPKVFMKDLNEKLEDAKYDAVMEKMQAAEARLKEVHAKLEAAHNAASLEAEKEWF